MAINHIEIEYSGNVTQSDLDELYITMDNLDDTSTIKGTVTVGNYTPMVKNALVGATGKFKDTLTIQTTGEQYLDINPKDKILKYLENYASDNCYVTLSDAAAKTSLATITLIGMTNSDGICEANLDWIDNFTKISKIPSVSSNTLNKVTYTGTKPSTNYSDCRNLKYVDMPNVVSFPYNCFQYCSKLEQVNIPFSKLSGSLPDNLFSACTKLQLPNTLHIGNEGTGITAIKSIFQSIGNAAPEEIHIYMGTTCDGWPIHSIGYSQYAKRLYFHSLNGGLVQMTSTIDGSFYNMTYTHLDISCFDFSSRETGKFINQSYGNGLPNLEYLRMAKNCKFNVTLQKCSKLVDEESLQSLVDGLYDFTENGVTPTSSQATLTLHANTKTAVTNFGLDTQITAKGWTIA